MTGELRRHEVAVCRWCGGQFVFIFNTQWICENERCAERQIEHAILRIAPIPGETPYVYLPLPLQVDMKLSTAKRLLVAGAAGACKSYGARWFAYSECHETPGLQVLLVRSTFPSLDKNHLQFMDAETKRLTQEAGIECKYVGGNVRKVLFANGSVIHAGYCDDEGDIGQHLGPEWDRFIAEEANLLLPAALSEIAARDRGSLTAQRPDGVERDGRTVLIANPEGRGSQFLIDTYIEKSPDPDDYPTYNASIHDFIPARLEDNPYLKADFATTTLSGLTAARYRQMRYGDWKARVGLFFETFDSDVHVRAEV